MSHRALTKRHNRDRSLARKALVHMAGCIYRFRDLPHSCCTLEYGDFRSDPRVRVPRSLRWRFGQHIGGA